MKYLCKKCKHSRLVTWFPFFPNEYVCDKKFYSQMAIKEHPNDIKARFEMCTVSGVRTCDSYELLTVVK